MGKLNKLIQELCSDGVEYKPLWSVTIWDKNFNAVDRAKQSNIKKYKYILSNELKSYARNDGNIKILTTYISDLWALEKEVSAFVSEGEIVCIPWGGNATIQYYKGKFITGDNRIATSLNKNILDNKFLYYCMENNIEYIASFYRGSGIKHPDMSKVLDMEIPIPPLPIQKEIVRIFDTFSQLQAELQAELQARKKQYEYYKNKLLTFTNEVPFKRLDDVIVSLNTGLNPRKFFKLNTEDATNYYVTIREIHNNRIQFSDSTDRINNEALKLCNNRSNLEVGDVLFSGTGTIGETAMIEENPKNWNIKEGVYVLKPITDVILSKFLMYLLQSQSIRISYSKKVAGGTVKSIPMKDLKNIVIPVPSLLVQKRIVSILDRFDIICNDLTQGIPAEIEARQKQYKYYCEKILTFKRK